MTPSPLLGGMPGTATTGSGIGTGRANGTDGSAQGSRFERLMQQGERSGTPRSKADEGGTSASQPPRADAGARRGDSSTPRADAADAEAPTVVDGEHEANVRPAPAAADDTPAWPTEGLAGLALSMPQALMADVAIAAEPAMAATAPMPSSTAAAAALQPALAAASDPSAAIAAMPADAAGEEAAVDELAAMLATAPADQADSDATAPTAAPLHGIGALHAVRGGAELAELRAAPPTPTPVLGQEGFDDALSARIGWLADQKIGHAHIRISPDDLGAIDVRLQMDGDKVNASFSSPHVDVRHALESSLPRLRELLGEQGFQLAHADVGQHAQGNASSHGNRDGAGDGGGRDGDPSASEVTLSAAQLIRQRGLLDAYA